MDTNCRLYLETVLALYLRFPHTPNRLSRYDRSLALLLYNRNVPLPIIDAAFLLTSARRLFRDPARPPLTPIRSLHYFLPVIEELLDNPLSPAYIEYLHRKLASHLAP